MKKEELEKRDIINKLIALGGKPSDYEVKVIELMREYVREIQDLTKWDKELNTK